MRLTWAQPEDLLPHGLRQARDEGTDVVDLEQRWQASGGDLTPSVSGATDHPASAAQRELARELMIELDRRAATPELEPSWRPVPPLPQVDDRLPDRVLGAWLGRAAGCLLGKPVEKLPRHAIREIAEATGNWPIRGYFTAVGLPAEIAERWPWNRRSAPTSLVENIDGMPEDDDMNFPLLALGLYEQHGDALQTEDVAQVWLADLPAMRVFTAERIAYRNLLDAVPVEQAGQVGNPFREWIGAMIRTDVYGWVHPGDPYAAAALARTDALLSHRRNGVYGAMFVAAASAAAVAGADVSTVLETGLSVVPAGSALDEAVRAGAELGRSGRPREDALDELHVRFGHLHWVHALNNAALVAYALTAADGDFVDAVGAAVTGGWDTDSAGATVGALMGAVLGAAALPASFVEPLHNRLATSLPGLTGIGFDELAARTLAVAA